MGYHLWMRVKVPVVQLDCEFVFVLDNLVSTINCDGLVSRVFLQQYIFAGYCSWVGLS